VLKIICFLTLQPSDRETEIAEMETWLKNNSQVMELLLVIKTCSAVTCDALLVTCTRNQSKTFSSFLLQKFLQTFKYCFSHYFCRNINIIADDGCGSLLN
jgi:hypothetical protein